MERILCKVLEMVNKNAQGFFSLGKTVVENLENDLKNLLETYSGDGPKALGAAASIVAKYSEEHRFYHNLSHVAALLASAEKLTEKFADEESARLAVWFHDAIYEPKSPTNEIDSAELAVKTLGALNFPAAQIERVEKMILATEKHDAAGLDVDGRFFLDLDLGILGASAEIYQEYAKAIRREYSFAPENLYREKRREILRRFLQREFIYYSDELRELLEQRARTNIANEIKELS
jgi:predicted metal-dependent HD superfamily phosphohydrolase